MSTNGIVVAVVVPAAANAPGAAGKFEELSECVVSILCMTLPFSGTRVECVCVRVCVDMENRRESE